MKLAFPRPISGESHNKPQEECREVAYEQDGMTLLEYYAGQALVGAISGDEFFVSAIETAKERNVKYTEWIATGCFEFAEAMIKEAEKRPPAPTK